MPRAPFLLLPRRCYNPPKPMANLVTDPICGMTFPPEKAAAHLVRDGKTIYFCADACRRRFEEGSPPPSPTPGAKFTCPMHPEIVRDGPGSCPKCGMALEPMSIRLDDAPDPELADMTRRLWVCAFVTSPLFAVSMAEMV